MVGLHCGSHRWWGARALVVVFTLAYCYWWQHNQLVEARSSLISVQGALDLETKAVVELRVELSLSRSQVTQLETKIGELLLTNQQVKAEQISAADVAAKSEVEAELVSATNTTATSQVTAEEVSAADVTAKGEAPSPATPAIVADPPQERCGAAHGACNCAGRSQYCNVAHGWCGDTAEHKAGSGAGEYDCGYVKECHNISNLYSHEVRAYHSRPGACKVGLERWDGDNRGPFQPGQLDVVISYFNESGTKRSKTGWFGGGQTAPDGSNTCGYGGAGCAGATPCCKGYSTGPHGNTHPPSGTCGIGPEYCDCPDCLDYRVVSPDKYSTEIRWLLRGIDTNLGIFDSESNPEGMIRRVFLVYNSVAGNGPPAFVDWSIDTDLARAPPVGCLDKTYVSGGGTLVAVPHCLIFPPGGSPPGNNRDASQMSVIRIPGLARNFW